MHAATPKPLGMSASLDADAVAHCVLELVEHRLAHTLFLTRLADRCDDKKIDHDHGAVATALLERAFGRVNDGLGVVIDLGVPIIGIGAPAAFLLPGAGARLHTEVILPRDGDVANAVGAITSQVKIEQRVTIMPDELGRFHVNGLPGAPVFAEMPEAQHYAEIEVEASVRRKAIEAGAIDPEVTILSDDRISEAADGVEIFIARTLYATAAGR